MLYRPEAFERPTDTPWDEVRVGDAIRRIVADADAAFDADALWPADEWDGWQAATPMKNLYVGAAGVIHALDVLRRRGLAETRIDLAAAATRAVAAFRDSPDFMRGESVPDPPESALLRGESGILLVAWRLTRSRHLELDLLGRVRRNVENEADEVMWGSPGTLIAARAMLEWIGSGEWEDACRETAEALWARRNEDGSWTQHLHGAVFRGLTPLHGVTGNVLALVRNVDAVRRERLERETAALLEREAVVEDARANWPMDAGTDLTTGDGEIRLQWCAGAAGVVACTASYLDAGLLVAGGELAWHAGAPGMEKGSGICHGTAGTGYAFLKLFERTGDEEWLARARRFALHALEQVERRGRGRYSLFTGDPGVALYAADCLEARAAYPILEAWD